jgi:hypothetical protein
MALTKLRIPGQNYLEIPANYSQLSHVAPPEYMVSPFIIQFINQSLHENYPEYVFGKIIMTNGIDIMVSGIGIFINGNINTLSPGAHLEYPITTDKSTHTIYKSCKCFAQNNTNIYSQIYRYITSNLHENTHSFIGIGGEPYVYANILHPIYRQYTFVTDSKDVLESCKYNTRDSKFANITDYLMVDYNKSLPDLLSSCKQPVTIIINLVKLYASVISLLIALKPYVKSVVIISCNKKDFDKKSSALAQFYNFVKKDIICPITNQCVTVYSYFAFE